MPTQELKPNHECENNLQYAFGKNWPKCEVCGVSMRPDTFEFHKIEQCARWVNGTLYSREEADAEPLGAISIENGIRKLHKTSNQSAETQPLRDRFVRDPSRGQKP